jgi:iron complex transport system substrate-binding protein
MDDTKPPRVLSLLSAATEIVYRLGCDHLLVGRSHGCDDPPLAVTLPVATAPRIDPNAPSAQIDEAVRAQSVAGGPVYHIHADLVKRLRPDVVITQEQCRICAVTPEDVTAACALSPGLIKLVTIKPITLDDVLGDVTTIATALGVPERGERLINLLRARLASLSTLTVRPRPSS